MDDRKLFTIWSVIFVVGLATWLVTEFGIVPVQKSGFYCNDPKLSHKYEGDTISIASYLTFCAVAPLIMMLIFEPSMYKPETLSFSDKKFKMSIINTLNWSIKYLLVYLLNLFIMDMVKQIIREPRPHFFDTCRPDKLDTCVSGEFVINYNCTNKAVSAYLLKDCDKSFPSGHSSISVYTAIFVIVYLQERSKDLIPTGLKSALQTSAILLGTFCSISRITDHRHHWWDVLAGTILGISLSYYLIVIVCKNFSMPKVVPSEGVKNGNAIKTVNNGNASR